MQTRTMGVLGVALLSSCLALAADKPPVFIFGGKQLYVGMSRSDALASLSGCCKLSPPADSEIEKQTIPGGVPGHFIIPKDDSEFRIMGTIHFSAGKVIRITRPLAENVDVWNDDLVSFVRALKRALPADSDKETTVVVSIRHQRISNAESDLVSLSFPEGRGLELTITTLDKSTDANKNKRDFVSLDETLVAAGYK